MKMLLVILLLVLHVTLYANDSSSSKKGMKLAFCVSGQLARFEIVSKIKNVFVANTLIGIYYYYSYLLPLLLLIKM